MADEECHGGQGVPILQYQRENAYPGQDRTTLRALLKFLNISDGMVEACAGGYDEEESLSLALMKGKERDLGLFEVIKRLRLRRTQLYALLDC